MSIAYTKFITYINITRVNSKKPVKDLSLYNAARCEISDTMYKLSKLNVLLLNTQTLDVMAGRIRETMWLVNKNFE